MERDNSRKAKTLQPSSANQTEPDRPRANPKYVSPLAALTQHLKEQERGEQSSSSPLKAGPYTCDNSVIHEESDSARSSYSGVAVRDIPVKRSRYLHIWKRVRAKLQLKFVFGGQQEALRTYGTSSIVTDKHGNATINKQLFKRQTTKVLDEADQEEYVPFCMFHPSKVPKGIWNVVLSFLLLYTATVMPYKIAFIEVTPDSPWFIVDLIIDILFFTDFLVNCFSAYYDEEGIIVINRKKILCNYFRTWMIPDLIACIPFNFIDAGGDDGGGGGGMNSLVRLIRLPRLYRLVRITRIFKALQSSDSEFMEKFQDVLNIKQSSIRVFTSLLTALICLHLASCFWYFTAKLDAFHPDTWVVRYGYRNDSDATLYITSFYWAITTLSTVGYGDISAETQMERILAMFWILFSVLFFAFTVGNLTTMLSSVANQEQILSDKLLVIDDFCKDANIGSELRRRLKHALKFSTEQTGFNWKDQQDLFNELPRPLRYEVSLAMYSGAIKTFPFFMDKDQVFVINTVPFLTPIAVPRQEFVYKENESADEVYFIQKGRVGYVFGEQNIAYKIMVAGIYFGEIEVLKKELRKDSTQANQDCELLVLKGSLLLDELNNFPKIKDEVYILAGQRAEQNKKAKSDVKSMMAKDTTASKYDIQKRMSEMEDERKDTKDVISKEEIYSHLKVGRTLEKLNSSYDHMLNNIIQISSVYKDAKRNSFI